MTKSARLHTALWIVAAVTLAASTALAAGWGPPQRAENLAPVPSDLEVSDAPVLRGQPAHDLVSLEVLRPEPESEVQRTYLLGHRADGGTVLFGQRRFRVTEGGPVQSDVAPVEFRIDAERGTYWARPIPSPRGQDLTSASQALETDLEQNQGYYFRYYVETWEPARHFIPVAVLNRTSMEVEWSECFDEYGFYDIQLDTVWEDCWANPQTFVYTTWYNNLCQAYGGSPWAWVDAHYYNYDFGFDFLRTDVDLTLNSIIEGQGYINAWFSFFPSGEAASFLTGVEGPEDWGYTFDRCPAPPPTSGGGCCTGGGDDGGDGGDGGSTGGSETCVPVYDGETDEYLGDCCGETTSEIVSCAEGFL